MTPSPTDYNFSPLGIHYLVECKNCTPELLTNLPLLKSTITNIAKKAGATVIETLLHQFNPYGLSGIVIIAESHLAIHTWPEHGYAAIDIFTCGNVKVAENIYQEILQTFKPSTHNITKINRKPPQET